MTKDDITRMARKAGFVGFDGENKCLREFAALVAADEREACAKVCEEMRPSKAEFPNWHDKRFYDGCTFSAAAIRARGNT